MFTNYRPQLLKMLLQYFAGLLGAALGACLGIGVDSLLLLVIRPDSSSELGMMITVAIIALIGLFAGAHYGTMFSGKFYDWMKQRKNQSPSAH
jgi:hypothetical protein